MRHSSFHVLVLWADVFIFYMWCFLSAKCSVNTIVIVGWTKLNTVDKWKNCKCKCFFSKVCEICHFKCPWYYIYGCLERIVTVIWQVWQIIYLFFCICDGKMFGKVNIQYMTLYFPNIGVWRTTLDVSNMIITPRRTYRKMDVWYFCIF